MAGFLTGAADQNVSEREDRVGVTSWLAVVHQRGYGNGDSFQRVQSAIRLRGALKVWRFLLQ